MVSLKLNHKLVRRQFSSHAKEYDLYAFVQARVIKRLLGLLQASGPFAGRSLDIGTGTGRLSMELAKTYIDLQPILLDIAHGMTLHASQSLSHSVAVDADASFLPFGAESFQLVVSSSVYQWVEDLSTAFLEVKRVLLPGGIFAFALFGEQSLFELKRSHQQALKEWNPDIESHAQDFPRASDISLGLDRANLEMLGMISENEVEYHSNVPTLLRNLKNIGAGNASSNRPPGLAARQVVQRMIEIYEGDFGTGRGIPATYEVIYGLARKSVR